MLIDTKTLVHELANAEEDARVVAQNPEAFIYRSGDVVFPGSRTAEEVITRRDTLRAAFAEQQEREQREREEQERERAGARAQAAAALPAAEQARDVAAGAAKSAREALWAVLEPVGRLRAASGVLGAAQRQVALLRGAAGMPEEPREPREPHDLDDVVDLLLHGQRILHDLSVAVAQLEARG